MTEQDRLLADLIDALKQQTQAINNLANSNMLLIDAMDEDDDQEEMQGAAYLSGKPA